MSDSSTNLSGPAARGPGGDSRAHPTGSESSRGGGYVPEQARRMVVSGVVGALLFWGGSVHARGSPGLLHSGVRWLCSCGRWWSSLGRSAGWSPR